MKKNKLFALLLVITIMLSSNACKKNEQQNPAKENTEITNEENASQTEEKVPEPDVVKTVVNSARYYEGIVEVTTDEQQYFLLKEDIVLEGRNVGFNGSNITVAGEEERVSVIMSSTGGFYFDGFTYPNSQKEFGQMTFKNVDFINGKGTGSGRENCYVYAYAENVTYENCTFDGNNTAYGLVKVADDSEVGATLKIADCTFCNISNKAAVYVNGCTDVTTKGANTYTNCTAGAILAKGEHCTINGKTMVGGTSLVLLNLFRSNILL